MTLLLNFTDRPRTRAVPSCAGSLPQKRKPRKKENPLFRGGAGLHRGYIGRGLPGGSGCGFSKGFTDFNPAPDFNFLLRADDFAFFAFIRVSPLLAFRLLAWSPSSCLPHRVPAACHLNCWLRTVSRSAVLHYPCMQPARQFQPPSPKTPCPCFCNTCRRPSAP